MRFQSLIGLGTPTTSLIVQRIMNVYPDIPSFFAEQGPAHIERFVSLNLDLSQRIYDLLQEGEWTEADLARAMDLGEADISLRLSGTYDWSLRELVKLEGVLGAEVLRVTQEGLT